MKHVESYLVQLLENKLLSGVVLTKEEREFLACYNQANDELFEDWLEVAYWSSIRSSPSVLSSF